MKVRRQAHCVYRCGYHVVFIPKYGYKVLTRGVKEYLGIKLDEVRKYYPELEYLERNIQLDHVHLFISFPSKYSVAQMVGIIKQNTSRSLKEKFDFVRQRYIGTQAMWFTGYFVSTVGLDESMIRNYIKYQEKEDLGQATLALG